MAAAAILNLLFLSILVKWFISGGNPLHFCKISSIYVNRRLSYYCLCKNPRWRLPPSWILFLFNILAYLHVGPPGDLFPVKAVYPTAKFHLSTSIGG